MPTLVYLIRHALTTWNRDRRFQGHLDIPLSPEGEEQAEAVAEWLAARDVDFTALYSSDLRRASQTADAIGRRLGLNLVLRKELREMHCGAWQGLSVEEVEERYPGQLERWTERIDFVAPPGGESIPDLQRRVIACYRELAREHDGQAIIIVSHGAALAALQAGIHGWDLVDAWRSRRARMGNTGVTAIEVEIGTTRVLLTNSSEHLPEPTGMKSLTDPAAPLV